MHNLRSNIGISKPISKLHKPIFILGSHKSGTSLLRSLLDNHKELFVFPRETHFFQVTGHWVDYGLRRTMPIEYDRESLIQSLIRYIKEQNKQDDPYSDSPDFPGYDLKRFISFMEKHITYTKRELFETYMAALHFSLKGTYLPEHVRIVEKSVENSEYAHVFQCMFPDSFFIHVVRNPYATIVAIRKAKARNKYIFMGRIASSLYNSYYHLFKNQDSLERYLVIRYEDLVTDTEMKMRQVADFLGIEFCEDILRPTSLGRLWEGNSTSNHRFQKVSTVPMEQWKNQINNYEIHLINRMAAPVINRYGYERLEPRRSKCLPVKGERIRTYTKNRLLLSMW